MGIGLSLVSAAETLTTVGIKIPISTAAPSTTTVSPPVITESIVTTAPSTILKAKGITFRDAGETTTRTPTSVSSSSIKDKGKAKMVELEVPLNKKDQIRLDEELEKRLDAEEQEAARLERENVELQEQAMLYKVHVVIPRHSQSTSDARLSPKKLQKKSKSWDFALILLTQLATLGLISPKKHKEASPKLSLHIELLVSLGKRGESSF
ncbi:hypothetical protein Tco_0864815 [Tanacetum coccineum]